MMWLRIIPWHPHQGYFSWHKHVLLGTFYVSALFFAGKYVPTYSSASVQQAKNSRRNINDFSSLRHINFPRNTQGTHSPHLLLSVVNLSQVRTQESAGCLHSHSMSFLLLKSSNSFLHNMTIFLDMCNSLFLKIKATIILRFLSRRGLLVLHCWLQRLIEL